MSKGDEIDELVSSVRNFVAHKEMDRMMAPTPADKLLLTPETRLTDEQVRAIDAEWAAELRALEATGIVPAGKAMTLSVEELEEAVAKLPDDWQDAALQTSSTPAENAFLEDDEDDFQDTVPEPSSREDVPVDMAAIESLIASNIGDLMESDALRALMVKTVHEELNGELGERITRNVRKLVRREINRVLASRDLTGD